MIFSTDEPVAVTGFGVNEALVFEGSPEMLSVTELAPPSAPRETVRLPLDPRLMVSVVTDRFSVKSPAGAWTVRLTVALCVRPPLVPVMVIVYVPAGVLEDVARVKTALAEPPADGVIELRSKVQAVFAGQPETTRPTALLKLFIDVAVTVELPD